MRKILALAAAIASAFAMNVAQADIILIDDFNSPSGVVAISDSTVAVVPVVSMTAGNGTAGSIGPGVATKRVVTVQQTSHASNDVAADIKATVGGGATGVLNFSVATQTNGTARVDWTIPAFALGVPSSYLFDVLFSAQGTTANASVPNQLDFQFVGGAGNFNLTNQFIGAVSSSTPVQFALSSTDVAKLAGGGTLSLLLSGGDAWNLVLDSLSLQTPEPTSLALVGLALVGAGVVSRRRKA
jgi:hypothetical protein